MDAWKGDASLPDRAGHFSAWGVFGVGVIYLAVVGRGVSEVGMNKPITDPILTVMELLTLMSALFYLALMAAIREVAPPDKKLLANLALMFAVLMTGVTCVVHFVALTAGRQTGFTVLEWPSYLYAAELLAWDVFLGLSLLLAAFSFASSGSEGHLRWMLVLSGALALAGALGPLLGDMAIQRIGILGYGVGLPVCAFMLARFFGRRSKGATAGGH